MGSGFLPWDIPPITPDDEHKLTFVIHRRGILRHGGDRDRIPRAGERRGGFVEQDRVLWQGHVGFSGVSRVVETQAADGGNVVWGQGGEETVDFFDGGGEGVGAGEWVAGDDPRGGGEAEVRGGRREDGVAVVGEAVFGDEAD